MTTILYHGGTDVIQHPLCKVGRDNLDFGKGFYLTDIKEQATRWALSVAARRRTNAIINLYAFDKDAVLSTAHCKIFKAYDAEWLDFIVANRTGKNINNQYDYVEGGIADDRIIDTVNLYIGGLISSQEALVRLSYYEPNNQICIINQDIIDKYLRFNGTESAK